MRAAPTRDSEGGVARRAERLCCVVETNTADQKYGVRTGRYPLFPRVDADKGRERANIVMSCRSQLVRLGYMVRTVILRAYLCGDPVESRCSVGGVHRRDVHGCAPVSSSAHGICRMMDGVYNNIPQVKQRGTRLGGAKI